MSDDDKFLRVLEAKSQDVGRGIVRIDPEVIDLLHLGEGDAAIVEGRKKTAAIVEGLPRCFHRRLSLLEDISLGSQRAATMAEILPACTRRLASSIALRVYASRTSPDLRLASAFTAGPT